MSNPIRVLLVEDHLVIRAALQMLLCDSGLVVVGETESCEGALELAEREQPDVILLDIYLTGQPSITCISLLKQCAPATRVLVLTGAPDLQVHQQAIAAGASGVVRKEQASSVLLAAIKSVHLGELWVEPNLAALLDSTLLEGATPPANAATLWANLTPRERDLVPLICEGLDNKSIAQRLGISERTVHNHLLSIFKKLTVESRLALAAFMGRHFGF